MRVFKGVFVCVHFADVLCEFLFVQFLKLGVYISNNEYVLEVAVFRKKCILLRLYNGVFCMYDLPNIKLNSWKILAF